MTALSKLEMHVLDDIAKQEARWELRKRPLLAYILTRHRQNGSGTHFVTPLINPPGWLCRLDWLAFSGSRAVEDPMTDTPSAAADAINEAFYAMERHLLQILTDIQGEPTRHCGVDLDVKDRCHSLEWDGTAEDMLRCIKYAEQAFDSRQMLGCFPHPGVGFGGVNNVWQRGFPLFLAAEDFAEAWLLHHEKLLDLEYDIAQRNLCAAAFGRFHVAKPSNIVFLKREKRP